MSSREMDIVDQLQEACTVKTDILELERLCGNARQEILTVRSMYVAQCQCTDEVGKKYEAEIERKGDVALMARIVELEDALARVNKQLIAVNEQSMLSAHSGPHP